MLVEGNPIGLCKCLESVKAHIDHWLIADCGMDSDSEDTIIEVLGDIPGEIVDVPSSDKAGTRNALLQHSQTLADYLVLMDADLSLELEAGVDNLRQLLLEDAYFITTDTQVRRADIRLIRTNKKWQYIGVANEFIACSDSNINIVTLHKAKLSKWSLPSREKAENKLIAERLDVQLIDHPSDTHALFFLAKHCSENQQHQRAIELFTQFIQSEQQWDPQWSWFALYQRAKLMEAEKASFDDVVREYEAAYEFRPERAEPLFELARMHRENNKFAKAEIYGQKAFSMSILDSETFDLDMNIYHWHIPNEYAIACQNMGHQAEAITAINRAIIHGAATANLNRSLIASRQRSVDALRYAPLEKKTLDSNRIRVVVPFRNAGELIKPTVASLLSQDYENFSATFIDDCSTDNTNDFIPRDDPRISLIKNTERVGPLVNRFNFILSCEPDDIVLYLDGDDQLASDDVLSYINEIYNGYDCWLTYGQYLSQLGNYGYAEPYPDQASLNDVIETGMMRFPMHPITHRAGLMHRLEEFDPNWSCFKDEQGDWQFYASDAVLARPLFIMAGAERIHYCNRVLYLYTQGHEISESTHNKADQIEACRIAALKLRPPKLQSYSVNATNAKQRL